METKIEKNLKIGNAKVNTTEGLQYLVGVLGKEKVCPHLTYMKAIKIDCEDMETDTGLIKWAAEDGTLISENGYHYNINCFI